MFKVTLEYKVIVQRGKAADPIVGKLKSWASKTRAALQQQPGPVRYPIRWTSERQRRAFFATDGFGRGIPTKRTGKLAKSWIVEVDFEGLSKFQTFTASIIGLLARIDPTKQLQKLSPVPDAVIITIDNPIPIERYVTGIQQQGFHRDTGWIFAPPIIENAVQEAEAILGIE